MREMNDAVEVLADVRAANKSLGSAEAFLHVGGYAIGLGFDALERLIPNEGWRACGFASLEEFGKSVTLNPAIKAAAEKRKKLAVLFVEAGLSQRKTAKVLRSTNATISRDVTNATHGKEKVKQNNEEKPAVVTNVTPTLPDGMKAATIVLRREERKARDDEAEDRRLGQAIEGPGSIDFRHGDFRAMLADLADKSIDAIITDPPYGHEYLPLLRDLAALADRVLKPDGVMAVLYGQSWLPEAMAQMTGFRTYRWTACYLTEGNGYVSQARKTQSNWKPLLIYGGGPRFGDVFRSGGDGAAKERHEWGQDFGAFSAIIEALTEPGALIVDPFAGGGTTLIAAKALGRHAIGCEKDDSAATRFNNYLEASANDAA